MNQADEVVYALQGIQIARDAAGRIISAGDWVIRSIVVGHSAVMRFARAFPHEELTKGQKVGRWGSDKLKVLLYTTYKDTLTKSTVLRSDCLVVMEEASMPEAVRIALAGTREELEVRIIAQREAQKIRHKEFSDAYEKKLAAEQAA